MEESTQCHQYLVKKKNMVADLNDFGLTKGKSQLINLRDLDFRYVDKENHDECQRIKRFIEKYEWLKRMPSRPTHRFVAYYQEKIVAVVVMATPYAKSAFFGKENWDKEKLIARGASNSLMPKNIGSWMIMMSIDWMVKNTEFRYFTAYCDPEANELGSIYQACNFLYVGQAGARNLYYDPNNPQRGEFNSRLFRRVNQYKKLARKMGIKWHSSWNTNHSMNWSSIPEGIRYLLLEEMQIYKDSCESRKPLRKHKYVLIKGRTKRETKQLLKRFYELHPKLSPKGPHLRGGLPYPKERGK